MSDKPLVIYHGNCADGFTAAWICHRLHPNWEYYPATHGDPPPSTLGRDVIIMDFSYNRDTMLAMVAGAKSVVILDHHVSAQKALQGLDKTSENCTLIFDMEKSGARLAWEYFYQEAQVPWLVAFVEDRDLGGPWGTPRYADTREVSAAIFSYEYTWENWDNLYRVCEDQRQLQFLIAEGAAIERKHHKDIAELLERLSTKLYIGGHHVPAANMPYTLASDAAHKLAEGAPFAACWFETAKGIEFSLRSRPDGLDVSEIAKQYGGGGHKHAAGFRITEYSNVESWLKGVLSR